MKIGYKKLKIIKLIIISSKFKSLKDTMKIMEERKKVVVNQSLKFFISYITSFVYIKNDKINN
jgi:hypothetical protein